MPSSKSVYRQTSIAFKTNCFAQLIVLSIADSIQMLSSQNNQQKRIGRLDKPDRRRKLSFALPSKKTASGVQLSPDSVRGK